MSNADSSGGAGGDASPVAGSPAVAAAGVPRPGLWLMLWVVLAVGIQTATWVTGFRPVAIVRAVEAGAANVENQVIGEVADDVIHKAIETQRATLPFWQTVAWLGDFVFEPFSLIARAALSAIVFASLAALRGRSVELAKLHGDTARLQGFWVLGMLVRSVLMIVLRRADVETSLVLLLPAGSYDGALWSSLQQVDAFGLMGWTAIGRAAVGRRQARALGAVLICFVLWVGESLVRVSVMLVVEAGMHLTILPET